MTKQAGQQGKEGAQTVTIQIHKLSDTTHLYERGSASLWTACVDPIADVPDSEMPRRVADHDKVKRAVSADGRDLLKLPLVYMDGCMDKELNDGKTILSS